MADKTTCIAVPCGNQTDRTFCGSCFWKLPEDIRRRLQIGATKTKRNPADRRAASKYALVVADAIELLRSKVDGDEKENVEEEDRDEEAHF